MTATMNISMPEALRDYVKNRVGEGDFSTPSDYVRALIRADRERLERQQLEQLLLQRLSSDDDQEFSDQDWQSIRARLAGARKAQAT